ncbi:MAG: PEP-CTERM sorting domain-containing protein [Rhodospirillaceae bacterium]|nr:PEP-CTERM sorting domain-containing protein [Rhodospirillaceae bacterium]
MTSEFHLYGISETLTVASQAVIPEPGSLSLLALGLVGLAVARRKRAASTRQPTRRAANPAPDIHPKQGGTVWFLPLSFIKPGSLFRKRSALGRLLPFQ